MVKECSYYDEDEDALTTIIMDYLSKNCKWIREWYIAYILLRIINDAKDR